MIPRLAPALSPVVVTISVNMRLRPYFELWFSKEKKPGETPAQFALRKLKDAAVKDYLEFTVQDERDSIDESTGNLHTALNDDVVALSGELD